MVNTRSRALLQEHSGLSRSHLGLVYQLADCIDHAQVLNFIGHGEMKHGRANTRIGYDRKPRHFYWNIYPGEQFFFIRSLPCNDRISWIPVNIRSHRKYGRAQKGIVIRQVQVNWRNEFWQHLC